MSDKELFFAYGNNPEMIEAFKNAQRTFKYFWRELSWEYRRMIPALNVACVKIAFAENTENGERLEHMWINDVQFDGNIVKGTLINNPSELTNIAYGDFVEIPLNQISDWIFALGESESEKPVVYGGHTIQAMRAEMNDQEREEHDDAWGLNFGDYNEVLLVHEQKEKPENLIEHPMSKNMREKLIEFLNGNPDEITNSDEDGVTLLHREVIAGNLTSVDVLLSLGADKNNRTNKGESALDLAKKMNWEHIIPVLEK